MLKARTMRVHTWTHPDPQQFALFISIAGIDHGHFSEVLCVGPLSVVQFTTCDVRVELTRGPLQAEYRL